MQTTSPALENVGTDLQDLVKREQDRRSHFRSTGVARPGRRLGVKVKINDSTIRSAKQVRRARVKTLVINVPCRAKS